MHTRTYNKSTGDRNIAQQRKYQHKTFGITTGKHSQNDNNKNNLLTKLREVSVLSLLIIAVLLNISDFFVTNMLDMTSTLRTA